MNWDNTTLFSDDHPGDAAFRAENDRRDDRRRPETLARSEDLEALVFNGEERNSTAAIRSRAIPSSAKEASASAKAASASWLNWLTRLPSASSGRSAFKVPTAKFLISNRRSPRG